MISPAYGQASVARKNVLQPPKSLLQCALSCDSFIYKIIAIFSNPHHTLPSKECVSCIAYPTIFILYMKVIAWLVVRWLLGPHMGRAGSQVVVFTFPSRNPLSLFPINSIMACVFQLPTQLRSFLWSFPSCSLWIIRPNDWRFRHVITGQCI